MTETLKQLNAFMRVMMEIDEIYNAHAARSGLSASAFWLFYALLDRERASASEPYTQRQFCHEWSFSPQTANSCLKKLREEGHVELLPIPGAKREKQICLTEKGRSEAIRLIEPLMEAECRVFAEVPAADREAMSRALVCYRDLLSRELSAL